MHIAADRNLRDPRFPVEWVVRPGTDDHHDYRGYAGQLAGGVWRPGDEVLVLPSGGRSRIAAIETFDGAVEEAFAPMSVTLRLADDLDVSRGDVICRPHNRATVSRDIDATVCWMSDRPAAAGGRYLVRQGTRTAQALLRHVVHRIDVDTLHRDESVGALALNDIGRVQLRTNRPLVFDGYARNRALGSFILDRRGHERHRGGRDDPRERAAACARADRARHPHRRRELAGGGADARGARWGARAPRRHRLDHRAPRVGQVDARRRSRADAGGARPAALRLDGDNLRHGLNDDLGFEASDRAENVRRTAHVSRGCCATPASSPWSPS